MRLTCIRVLHQSDTPVVTANNVDSARPVFSQQSTAVFEVRTRARALREWVSKWCRVVVSVWGLDDGTLSAAWRTSHCDSLERVG